MYCIESQHLENGLTFIEPESYLDRLLIDEVEKSDDLKNILVMLLLDDTLSATLKRQVEKQLKKLQGRN
ncbi:hypothetical protein PALB_14300 [Pseudoalteromonas luteoviolacea B = ATCC 29581]|nr:hypothetical protein PALB_14300 [Pseudoalteromonas luteoviolacea B = ATCC 29581]